MLFQIGQRPREFVTTISELVEVWRNFFRLMGNDSSLSDREHESIQKKKTPPEGRSP